MTQAYQALGWSALGLPDGRTLQLRPWDYVPPSWASSHPHEVSQLLAIGAIAAATNVTDARATRVAQAESAIVPVSVTPALSLAIDGFGAPVNERFNTPSQLWDP